MNLRWLRGALSNLESIRAFCIIENLESEATRQLLRIKKTIEQLQTFPELGRPGRVEGTRELVINKTPFIAIYRISKDNIEILRVLHTSQSWPQ